MQTDSLYDRLTLALESWRAALGGDHVVTDPDRIDAVNQTTFGVEGGARAMICPANAEEVSKCLQIAQHHKVHLYPVSTGHNWGYGSRVAPTQGGVLLSLARLLTLPLVLPRLLSLLRLIAACQGGIEGPLRLP